MQCSNHPDVVAAVRCDGCAEPHCAACIVEVQGQKFCAACKVIVVKDRKGPPPRPLQQGVICDEAKYALMMAVGGMTCCLLGFVLHPIAFIMAHQAVEKIKYNKGLIGIEIARLPRSRQASAWASRY